MNSNTDFDKENITYDHKNEPTLDMSNSKHNLF